METELIQMLEHISGRKFEHISMECSLFSSKLGLSARDITYFLLELEEKHGVILSSEKINDRSYFTLENIQKDLEEVKVG